MAKDLEVNPDGSMTATLIDREVVFPARISLLVLGQLRELIAAADAELPTPELPENPDDPKQQKFYSEQLRKRADVVYSAESPYAKAFVAAVKLATGEEVSVAELPGTFAGPEALVAVVQHFQNLSVGGE